MADFDHEAADRQSRRIAQIIFWVIFAVILAIAAFATWAAIGRMTFGVFPPFFMMIVAAVMWAGVVGLGLKAYRGNEQRKRDMHEE